MPLISKDETALRTEFPVSGGDGSSLEDAIVIHYDAGCSVYAIEERIQSSLFQRYCQCVHLVRQELLSKDGRIYDHFVYDCQYRADAPPGADFSSIYFDITECWNRMYKDNK